MGWFLRSIGKMNATRSGDMLSHVVLNAKGARPHKMIDSSDGKVSAATEVQPVLVDA